jgi:hypothetical protein
MSQEPRTSTRPLPPVVAALLAAAWLGGCGDDRSTISIVQPATPAPAEGAEPEPREDAPLFWQDVAPILQTRCVTCHQAGGVGPFVLDEYESASRWARAASAAVQARIMPPWLMTDDGSCQHFESSRYLSDAEIATIVDWAEAGAPEGTPGPAITPPSTGHLDGAVSYQTPDFTPVAVGDELARFDEYRCFRIGAPLDSPAYLTGYEVLPGNSALVHHVLVMPVAPDVVTGDGRTNEQVLLELDGASPDREGWPCFGAAGEGLEPEGTPVTWAPGMGPVTYPDGTGVRVETGTILVAQVHYNLAQESVRGQSDTTEIRLRLAESAAKPGIFDLPDAFLETLFEGEPASLPPGQAQVPFTWQIPVDGYLAYTGTSELQLYGVFPHMHELGRTMTIERVRADQPEAECLGDVPRWDFNWQLFYFYREPITLRAGDQLRVTCNFDTSSRTEATLPGWGTQNEMCLAGLFLVP